MMKSKRNGDPLAFKIEVEPTPKKQLTLEEALEKELSKIRSEIGLSKEQRTVEWTVESAQDLLTMHGIDAVAELEKALVEELSKYVPSKFLIDKVQLDFPFNSEEL